MPKKGMNHTGGWQRLNTVKVNINEAGLKPALSFFVCIHPFLRVSYFGFTGYGDVGHGFGTFYIGPCCRGMSFYGYCNKLPLELVFGHSIPPQY